VSGALTADGALAAVAAEGGSVQLWDVAAGRPAHVLAGHTAAAAQAVFSTDGALLATCSADCSLRVWDAHTGARPALSAPRAGVRAASANVCTACSAACVVSTGE